MPSTESGEQPRPRVLLTNDDGIEAPGLWALERAFARRGADVWVVAPDRERSACSHGMTLRRALVRSEVGPQRFSLDGLPADCVYLALCGLLARRPDVVVSGINRGPNLGADVVYSGTVAGAREAALQGVHGLAASLIEGDDFERAARSVVEIAHRLAALEGPALLLNVNYPAGRFRGPRPALLGVRNYPKRVSPEGEGAQPKRRSFWLGGGEIRDGRVPGTDGDLVAQGIASATLLRVDQTDFDAMVGEREPLAFLKG